MNKQDYIEAFGREIEPLFANTNSLASLRESIIGDVERSFKAKKISDAKNQQIHAVHKETILRMYNKITSEFPEIAHRVKDTNGGLMVDSGGFYSYYITLSKSYTTIDGDIDHREWSFDPKPFRIDDSCYENEEEMYSSAKFKKIILDLYKRDALGKSKHQ